MLNIYPEHFKYQLFYISNMINDYDVLYYSYQILYSIAITATLVQLYLYHKKSKLEEF